MCAWRPRQTKLGNLPNISYIMRKPEPLGTEFKTACCPMTGVMTCMEIQRGKEGMKNMRLQADLGATASCTIRCAEGCHQGGEGLKDSVKGDAWFGSVKCAVALAQRGRAFFWAGQVKPRIISQGLHRRSSQGSTWWYTHCTKMHTSRSRSYRTWISLQLQENIAFHIHK